MKKFISLLLIFVIFLVGCDGEVTVAHLSEATQGLSNNYVVKLVLDDDSRYEEKAVDLEIMASSSVSLYFHEEGEDVVTLDIATADEWYGLTVLLSKANGSEGYETYSTYKDYGNRIYIFSSDVDVSLSFRVVAGEAIDNQDATGSLLTAEEKISNILKVDVKAQDEE